MYVGRDCLYKNEKVKVKMKTKSSFTQPRTDRLFTFVQATDEKTFLKQGARIRETELMATRSKIINLRSRADRG